ncbi:uncharacterized protein isoform X6 [Rhodnius prolixus]|uniref:uncharacterized protein isoform X6 n=1 Tax=Rhodnius prolixus TaxID=13249 RepID=UPI003D18DDC3
MSSSELPKICLFEVYKQDNTIQKHWFSYLAKVLHTIGYYDVRFSSSDLLRQCKKDILEKWSNHLKSLDLISKHKDALINAPMIVMDGNLSEESMLYTLNVAAEHRTPIWFEPTELKKAAKPFSSELWKSITCTSPNLNELITIAKTVGVSGDISGNIDDTDINTLIKLLAHLTIPLAEYIPVIMITLGRNGILEIESERQK